jgi:TonB-dependent starch-binding outer membrane protein SusC
MRPVRLFLLLMFVGSSAAAAVGGQVEMSAAAPEMEAAFQGLIVDSLSGEPIEGVLVRMDNGASTFTNRLGEFSLNGLPQGRRLFALFTSDCRITWGEITVVNGMTREERYRLPPSFGAAAEEEQEEEAQRKRTSGRVFEQGDIDDAHASSVLELIRRMMPGMVSPMQGAPGDVSALVSSRSRTIGAQTDAPVVVIDGVRTPGAEGTLSTMRPTEISRLEVQPGAAAGWEYGSAGASGVIKITMRRGIADGASDRQQRAACVVPEFPRG